MMRSVKTILMSLTALVLIACSQVGVETYLVTPAQFAAMREIAGIPPCPPGQINTALAVEMQSGGGTVSVKCGVDKLAR